MIDARINFGFPSHPKTKRVIRALGSDGAWCLVKLILWTAQNRADGDLSGMSADDIEMAVDWNGVSGDFVSSLVSVRFIDGSEGCYSVHNWSEHNQWAAGYGDRKEKAQWNAYVKHHGVHGAAERMPDYYSAHAASMKLAQTQDATSKDVAQTQDAPILSLPILSSNHIGEGFKKSEKNPVVLINGKWHEVDSGAEVTA